MVVTCHPRLFQVLEKHLKATLGCQMAFPALVKHLHQLRFHSWQIAGAGGLEGEMMEWERGLKWVWEVIPPPPTKCEDTGNKVTSRTTQSPVFLSGKKNTGFGVRWPQIPFINCVTMSQTVLLTFNILTLKWEYDPAQDWIIVLAS